MDLSRSSSTARSTTSRRFARSFSRLGIASIHRATQMCRRELPGMGRGFSRSTEWHVRVGPVGRAASTTSPGARSSGEKAAPNQPIGRHARVRFGVSCPPVHPAISREVDPLAIDDFLTLGYVPSPRSAFQHIRKLPPGHMLVWENGQTRVRSYWSLAFEPKLEITEGEAIERFDHLFSDAVRLRLISDVPLGTISAAAWTRPRSWPRWRKLGMSESRHSPSASLIPRTTSSRSRAWWRSGMAQNIMSSWSSPTTAATAAPGAALWRAIRGLLRFTDFRACTGHAAARDPWRSTVTAVMSCLVDTIAIGR